MEDCLSNGSADGGGPETLEESMEYSGVRRNGPQRKECGEAKPVAPCGDGPAGREGTTPVLVPCSPSAHQDQSDSQTMGGARSMGAVEPGRVSFLRRGKSRLGRVTPYGCGLARGPVRRMYMSGVCRFTQQGVRPSILDRLRKRCVEFDLFHRLLAQYILITSERKDDE